MTQATRIGGRDPAVIQKPMQRSTVSIANRIEEPSDERSVHVLRCPGPRSVRMREHISGVSVSEPSLTRESQR